MSPKLKPLLLPQLVEERRKRESASSPDMTSVFYTTTTNNSSSSDITSPVTPTFSARGHMRYSSSTSSLELPPLAQDLPSSPIQPTTKTGARQLPDVQEEPMEREDETIRPNNYLGLYSCLCDQPCQHRSSADDVFPAPVISDFDFDYDAGFLSDSDYSVYSQDKKKRTNELPFLGLTTRIGSRFNGMNKWKAPRKNSFMASPTTEVSHETAMSRVSSSRESSTSSPYRNFYDRHDATFPPTPAMSYHASSESVVLDLDHDDRASLERDRALAATPLLPPLLTGYPLGKPGPEESPLQSPSIAPSPVANDFPPPSCPSTTHFSRPSLMSKPSVSSLRHGPKSSTELPFALPAMLQEYDEWSDRLGHANFTITPLPYELDTINSETVTKFCQDWDAARVNYTKHLVRTGENYGQTSKIYALTEAKWAETERRWKTIYTGLARQTGTMQGFATPSMGASRSRSRGRGRGRSTSASAMVMGRPANDEIFANMEWRRLDDGTPSVVPRMLEALDAGGKFPGLGDEDIVGPMHRDEVMVRAESEERKSSRFWRNLAGKVGFRK
ncbi:hypothetical protein S40293_04328 [Stachybotrys chartarum IBT 40293]|nr:hypothetical protein S40293_04328 [Stachybotrys chartarum IBT 40293]